MKVNSLLLGVFGLLSLTFCGKPDENVELFNSENTANAPKEIFTEHKEFIYRVSCTSSNGQTASADTLVLLSSGSPWNLNVGQKKIAWGKRTAGKNTGLNGTGVVEDSLRLWIHPPRFDQYAILELSPFPEVKKPFIPGQQWYWGLEVGSQYANPAWAVWQGNMLVKTRYKATGQQTIETALGKLTCQEILATSTCAAGRSTLRTLYHPEYGFVLLDYVNIDASKMKLQLIYVGIENKFDGGAYFKK
ncbi:hypothetical protein [Hymenobacter norwichensis]|uniref:hypothetical protein n=1 Tax=Hymenobacter norwichensis TaxID=223903 RepID=UPI0003B70772|nr:hypothetical protein [Hymenobacter norwichensis]